MAKEKYKSTGGAILNGIKDLFKKRVNIGKLTDNDRLDGKTCLVTGANSGLGFAIATQLAQRGAHVIMACRSGIPEAGEKVKALSGSDKVEMMKVDLLDFDTIYALCDELKARQVQLDIVISNAAMVPNKSRKTKYGLEEMFQVNYLAGFVLINRLLQDGTIPNKTYAQNAQVHTPRIIIVSSEAHRVNRAIDFEHFGDFQEYSMGKIVSYYGYYKLILNAFVTELTKRLNPNGELDVSVHALCPGAVNTNIAREAPALMKPLVKVMFALFFRSPKKAAEPALYFACSPDMEGKTGLYLHLMTQKDMDEKALESEAGKKVWEKSEELLERILS